MRKRSFWIALLIFASSVGRLFPAGGIPEPSGWVNDFAGIIDEQYRSKLNNLIHELEEKTSAEIAVVTINAIAPYDEKEYARMLFDKWKPGKKGKDNGVLVLLAIRERRWRIETGYGVESILPDGICGEIGRNYMVPYFKDKRYAEGLYAGVAAIAGIIAKDANVKLSISGVSLHEPVGESANSLFPLILFLVFFGFLFLPQLFGRRSSRIFWWGGYGGGYGGSWDGGGGFGGGGFGGGGGGGGGAGGGF